MLRTAMALAIGAAISASRDVHADKQACVVAHEQAQELRQASKLVEAKEKLLTCSQSNCPALVRADCEPWLTDVEGALPSIMVAARDAAGLATADVRLFIDGALIGERLDGAIEVNPGEHRFRFEHAMSAPVEERLTILAGEKSRTLGVNFSASADTANKKHPNIWPYVLAGAGGLALGSFAYFGIKGKVDADACHGQCTAEQADPITSDLRAADISLVTGLVLTAAAVWLFLSPPSQSPPASSTVAAPLPWRLSSSNVRCEVTR
jgi:hypothetical protein